MDAATAADAITRFFDEFPSDAVAVYLFGSVASGAARPASDVDVAVLFRTAPAATLRGQPFELAEALGRRLGRTVDLVTLNTAPADLRIRVLRHGTLLVDRDPATRIRFEVQTRNEAFDLARILDQYRRRSVA